MINPQDGSAVVVRHMPKMLVLEIAVGGDVLPIYIYGLILGVGRDTIFLLPKFCHMKTVLKPKIPKIHVKHTQSFMIEYILIMPLYII